MSAPLTLADRSAISGALHHRAIHLKKLLAEVESMKGDVVYDRLRTQLQGELDRVEAAAAKVNP